MERDTRSSRQDVREQAARWVVRLADSAASDADRAAFAAWRDESFEHEAAYEREALAWRELDTLRDFRKVGAAADPELLADPQARPRRVKTAALAASFTLVAGASAVAVVSGLASPAYATGVGERRVVVLEDGSRIELNTDSKVVVRYRKGAREIELVRGEAMFDVVRGARPFVVLAKGARLTADRSEVVVRLRPDGAAVMVRAGAVTTEVTDGRAESRQTVAAGREMTISPAGAETHPVADGEIERLLAWRQGAVAFNGQSLAEAAGEFNRYNAQKIVVTDPTISDLRVGGYFRTSDLQGFVTAVTKTFPVVADRTADGSIRLIPRA